MCVFRRETRDADFLARGDNSPERFMAVFKTICGIGVEDDGLRLDPATVRASGSQKTRITKESALSLSPPWKILEYQFKLILDSVT